MIKRLIRYIALKYGRLSTLYTSFCVPSGEEYALFLKRHGGFYAIGNDCYILPWTTVADPAYVRLGNNVLLASCTLCGHDGSIRMLNIAYNVKLDNVGKIDIKDNVFVGHQAIILPGVTIGPNAIVAAGSVVTRDVLEGDIVAGVPAKPIGKVDKLVEKLEKETAQLPWNALIQQRVGAFDPAIEAELVSQRVNYFYGEMTFSREN